MMTNALPGDLLQVIGFLLHQNQRFIDHDKVVLLGQCFINGQKGTQAGEGFWSYNIFFPPHLQLNKVLTGFFFPPSPFFFFKCGRLQLGRNLKQIRGEGQTLHRNGKLKYSKYFAEEHFCLERYKLAYSVCGWLVGKTVRRLLFCICGHFLLPPIAASLEIHKGTPLQLDLCPYCLYVSLIKTLSSLPAYSLLIHSSIYSSCMALPNQGPSNWVVKGAAGGEAHFITRYA